MASLNSGQANRKRDTDVERRFDQGLNEDLASELGTVICYTYQSSKAVGFVGFELGAILKDEIADELDHASLLMDVIMDLGGELTTPLTVFDKLRSLKAILELDLQMKNRTLRTTDHTLHWLRNWNWSNST